MVIEESVAQQKPMKFYVGHLLHALAFLVGLVSLILLVFDNSKALHISEKFNTYNRIIVFLLIAAVLIHHQIIISNFKIIDKLRENDIASIGFVKRWIGTIPETIIRFLIFLMFAVLSGEIPYIIAICMKIKISLLHIGDHRFDLENLTIAYISISFFLSVTMLIWHFFSFICDFRDFINKISTKNTNPEIVSFPFNNILATLLISDIISFVIWLCFFQMFVIKDLSWYFLLIPIIQNNSA